MGIRYTKKTDENENKEKTVQAEEFINLMTSTKRSTRKIKELPRTEVGK
ncbi:hypothetical protein JHU38_08035 [Prevotella sp. A2931]|uniref:Uncharacterized protein n=1 Tax=Prevotella illustrans TaxID=2800387 RepID=A0ABS3M6E9_9BACT|nr:MULTISPECIES: hypothetical protein [Prevotella]MBO1363715.1 hypothetical protein [Prevotella illustrans]